MGGHEAPQGTQPWSIQLSWYILHERHKQKQDFSMP